MGRETTKRRPALIGRQRSRRGPRPAAMASASDGGGWPRNLLAFFVFGVANNIIYAIFLSAAVDILEGGSSAIPKSMVLLADIGPCILVKMVAPHMLRFVSYRAIVAACVALDTAALALVGFPTELARLGGGVVWLRFCGVLLASLSTGLGETAFLGLTTYFEARAVVAWSAGTGVAGLAGALYYLVMSSVLGLSLPRVAAIALVVPAAMGSAYLFLLDVPPARIEYPETPEHAVLDVLPEALPAGSVSIPQDDAPKDSSQPTPQDSSEDQASLSASRGSDAATTASGFARRMRAVRPLLLPYVLPLFLVFFAEYTINQSVYFALLYPIQDTPFRQPKDHYVTYQFLYMGGVFASRTFGRALPIMNVWIFTSGQLVMLCVLVAATVTLDSSAPLISSIWAVFALILVEGLFGGLAYVHAFCAMTHSVPPSRLEFSMAFTSVADSLGIGTAAVLCIFLEPYLCNLNGRCRAISHR